MGDRGHIFNHIDLESSSLQGTDCSLSAGTGTLNINLDRLETMLHSGLGSGFSRRLCGKWGGFTGTAESKFTCAGPRKSIALRVGDSNDGIVKRGLNMHNATFNIFALLAASGCCTFARTGFSSSHSSISSLFFLVGNGPFGTLAGAGIRF